MAEFDGRQLWASHLVKDLLVNTTCLYSTEAARPLHRLHEGMHEERIDGGRPLSIICSSISSERVAI